MTKCPITKALAALKRFAGLPVPEIVKWVDGKPDFRLIDEYKWLDHYKHKLCSICGRKLLMCCYWVGGPISARSHMFTDGPMHWECALESIKLCPFLSGIRQGYRGDLPHSSLQVIDGRPEIMYLMRGHTAAIRLNHITTTPNLWAGKQLTVIKKF